MEESTKIIFEGSSNHSKKIVKNGHIVGAINANYGEDLQKVTGYSVLDHQTNQTVNSACTTMNQAKAYAEYYFSK